MADRRLIVLWLEGVALVVFAMVIVGGITRLTQSGLSMVDWRPIMGIVPPLSHEAWVAAFEAYKQYPEFRLQNRNMDLDGFRQIFFWEYVHRLLGRLVGVVFAGPLAYFWWRGSLDSALKVRLVIALLLGGGQGLLGWYMVMSGLVGEPRVSHYRLAAHLGLALAILVYLFILILELRRDPTRVEAAPPRTFRRLAGLFPFVVSAQILFGAFTAGLDAGLGYNTFPLMNDRWLALGAFRMTPVWVNFIENGALVQFVHRWLAFVVLLLAAAMWLRSRAGDVPAGKRAGVSILLVAVVVQIGLGVATLLQFVPTWLASLHQAGACVVLLAAVYVWYTPRSAGIESLVEPLSRARS